MPLRSVKALAYALSSSSLCASLVAPKQGIFLSARYSLTPARSGASVPMNTASMLYSFTALYTASQSELSVSGRLIAISAVPGLPGAM